MEYTGDALALLSESMVSFLGNASDPDVLATKDDMILEYPGSTGVLLGNFPHGL
jgi:hypothetical protein